MKVHITARHLKLTSAIADYVTKKINRLQRHFDHLVWASAILSVEKYRHIAEIVIHSPLHTIRAKAESQSLYGAIDLAADKADKQLKKLKEKWRDSGRSRHSRQQEEASYLAAAALSTPMLEEMQDGRHGEAPSLPSLISVVKQVPVKPMTVREAIQAMESLGYNFWMFLNRTTHKYNVLFRRSDQTYGLMEPVKK